MQIWRDGRLSETRRVVRFHRIDVEHRFVIPDGAGRIHQARLCELCRHKGCNASAGNDGRAELSGFVQQSGAIAVTKPDIVFAKENPVSAARGDACPSRGRLTSALCMPYRVYGKWSGLRPAPYG